MAQLLTVSPPGLTQGILVDFSSRAPPYTLQGVKLEGTHVYIKYMAIVLTCYFAETRKEKGIKCIVFKAP